MSATMDNDLIMTILSDVKQEFQKASLKFHAFGNAHEGYAVLLEEVDELWDNVKLNQKNPDRQKLMAKEAIQVAAMAIRFLYDCCADHWDQVPIDQWVNKLVSEP
jgi:hypothetical protein